jgi:RNA polymerase primary sigma factor
MAVPEINGATVAKKDKNIIQNQSVAKEIDNSENRNITLARHVEEYKTKLIDALSQIPMSALWLLTKYEQEFINADQDEDNSIDTDLSEALKTINKCFNHLCATRSDADATGYALTRAKTKLTNAIKEFPFAFNDLTKLVDVILYSIDWRHLSPAYDSTTDKKHNEIIRKRLTKALSEKKLSIAKQFNAIGFANYEEKFLFLEPNEMSALVSTLILAEHNWLFYRQQLATANAKLVFFIANQYKGSFLDFDDLVQEGNSGLLKAVDRFKYRLGFQFSTYAGYWIRQAISRALSRSERVVRIPCGQIATINKVFRAKDELTLKTGCEPTVQELAERTNLTDQEINNILSISQTAIPLETFEDEDDDQAFAPISFLEQNVFTHSYDKIAGNQLQNLISEAVKGLNPREAKIISSHFGVGTDQQKTLQEIGSELNLTRERVRQIQVVALNKIKMRYGDQLHSFL